MNCIRRLIFGVISLTLVMQLAFVTQALAASAPEGAQNSQGSEQERLRRVMDPATDIEEFRRELYDYFKETEDAMRLFNEIPAVREKFEQAGLRPLALLAEAKQRLAELKPEDLSLMRATYARFPNWRETPRSIDSLIKPELRKMSGANKNEGGFQTQVADDCAAALAANHTNTDISIAAAVLIAAEAVMEGFPTDGLTILARLIPIAAVTAAKSALLAIETLKNIKDDCNGDTFETALQQQITNSTNTIINNDNANKTAIINNDNTNKDTILSNLTTAKNEIVNNDNTNKTTVISQINANTTTITSAVSAGEAAVINNSNANRALIITNDNTNTTNIINNATTNKNMIVANDNANTAALTTAINNAQTAIINNANANKNELRDLLLRTQIEADLAEADNATPVAWYLTPTANGGHLNLVQAIVTETLANIVAAGGSIGDAQSFLTQANADKAAGRFKDAYKNYRKAYKAAAN